MARSITGASATEVAKKLGTEPILILEIDWGESIGIRYYADRLFDGIPGKIISASDIDAVLKTDSTGASSSVSITLDDTDNSIRDILASADPQLRPAKIYQAFGALASSDKFLLLSGKLNSPMVWNEKSRQFQLEVVSELEDREYGFSPEEGEFEYIADSAIGKAWPLCFGSPIRVPAVRITDQVRGRSLTSYAMTSFGDLVGLCNAAKTLAEIEDIKETQEGNFGTTQAFYETILERYVGAATAVEQIINSLTFNNPYDRSSIINYANACKELRRAEIRRDFYFEQIANGTAAIEAAEDAIESLGIQIAQAQADGNTALSTTLKDSLVASEADLAAGQELESSATAAWETALSDVTTYTAQSQSLEATIMAFDLTQIIVENGENFPQNTPVQIIVNKLRLQGTFNDRVFTVLDVLATTLTPVEIDPENVEFTTQKNQFGVAATDDVAGLYGFTGTGIIHIDEQNGTTVRYTPLLMGKSGEITTVDGTIDTYDIVTTGGVQALAPFVFQSWVTSLRATGKPDSAIGLSSAGRGDWQLNIGAEVLLVDDQEDVYIANLIPSTDVHEVYGKRTIDGVESLLPIPSSYYTVTLSDDIANQTPTSIRFKRPLSAYISEQWSDEVYVTLTSSVGPNTADIIQFLIETYTNLTIDATTFAAVNSQIDKYPSHFALLTRRDTIATVGEIAWQARCAAFVVNGVVYLKYLANEEATLQTLTESDLNDLSVSLTPTESLVTKLIAKWTSDYSEDEHQFILRNNVPKYGLLEREFDFYIYNIRSLVEKSATFWLIRLSNTWKIARFTAWLDTLQLESFDTVAINLVEGIIASGSAKGFVQSASYDSSTRQIVYEVWTSIKAGRDTQYSLFWPASAAPGTVYPTADDLYAGGG